MSKNKQVFTLVTWGSETEKNCDILGVYESMNDAIKCIYSWWIDDLNQEFLDENIRLEEFALRQKNVERLCNFLRKGYIVDRCDYYKITSSTLGKRLSLLSERGHVWEDDGKIIMGKFEYGKGYVKKVIEFFRKA